MSAPLPLFAYTHDGYTAVWCGGDTCVIRTPLGLVYQVQGHDAALVGGTLYTAALHAYTPRPVLSLAVRAAQRRQAQAICRAVGITPSDTFAGCMTLLTYTLARRALKGKEKAIEEMNEDELASLPPHVLGAWWKQHNNQISIVS